MPPPKDRFLVVVAVLEGRKFPRRPKHKLIAEARFDGELLATDPIEHAENPDFTQEIAWELDKKGLSQHRLQRSSIKVQYYAVDTQSTMREPIGYVMLDLRSAQSVQTAKWYPLLHGKYSRSKPEVRLGIYIDDDTATDQGAFKAKSAPARPLQDGGTVEAESVPDALLLKPILSEDGDFYQIGSVDTCTEIFGLSVTVAFASNLTQLVPSNQPLPGAASGFFFYYSLLGNDVTIEPFYDLLSAKFPAERSTVRIRSSIDILRAFFGRQPGIQVHLCCGDQSLGSCDIPLSQLLKPGSTEIYMHPVLIEGSFQLVAPARLRSQMAPVSGDMIPSVGISIMLRKDDQIPPVSPTHQPGITIADQPPDVEQNKKHSPEKVKPKDKEKKGQTKSKSSERKAMSPVPQATHADDYSDDFISQKTDENVPSFKDEHKKSTNERKNTDKEKAHGTENPGISSRHSPTVQPSAPQTTYNDPQSHSSLTQQQMTVPLESRHFNFSIDLRAINNLDSNIPLNMFARYVYPFFGSSSPVITSPPVEVRRGTQVSFPQSFCAFDFATTSRQLENTFETLPLVVELWDRDRQKAQDVLVGLCQLPLPQILPTDKSRVQLPNGSFGWRQVLSAAVPIHHKTNSQQKMADLYVMLSLEDKGSVQNQQVMYPSETITQSEELASHQKPEENTAEHRESAEYQAALELELWKEVQENMFESKLKEKEYEHMKTLAEEWKRRDREREMLVKKKIGEYTQLEGHLKRTIADFEKREVGLANSEQEIAKVRKDLEREHERKMTETREASRRMKEDCDHQVEIEKMKNRELQEIINKYKLQLDEAERKTQNVDREFQQYKDQQNTKPEVRLQSEINLLTLEKVELERKMDAVTKSKVHYKQQWGRALKELARLKQKEQDGARALLKKQHQELEHMRLRYLAAEEKEVVKSEMKELENIKNEINKLKEQDEKRNKIIGPSSDEMDALKPDLDASFDDHIARLIEERDALLRTGVYTNEDRIISELDRQIREAISTAKSV